MPDPVDRGTRILTELSVAEIGVQIGVGETGGTPIGGHELFASEAAHVAQATAARREEFAAVRWCARRALRSIGVDPAPILPGRRGAPIWPIGVLGSMTHCVGYRAAAVAHARDVRALGIDAEPNERLPDDVADLVVLPVERAMLHRLHTARAGVHFDRLVFSAKESVFKALYPLAGIEMEFADAAIAVDLDRSRFDVRLLADLPAIDEFDIRSITGRWRATPDLVVTAVVLESD